MNIIKIPQAGSSPANKAPEQNFTGDVYLNNYFRRLAPSRVVSATVNFAPGSRTPWKVNPLGQTLIVTSGAGWVQCEGEEIVEIHAGDTIWFPPGIRHWEGATFNRAMTYVAVQEEADGKAVAFGEKVTDEEYRRGPNAAALM